VVARFRDHIADEWYSAILMGGSPGAPYPWACKRKAAQTVDERYENFRYCEVLDV
jgi:hypothetical protein